MKSLTMSRSLDESLYKAVDAQDCNKVIRLLKKGANPNRSVGQGKTCLGEAAYIGNLEILKILIDATNQTNTSSNPFKKRHYKPTKRKKQDGQNCDATKPKNFTDRLWAKFDRSKDEKNQGYFVCVHGESSSSDESRAAALKSPISPYAPYPMPHELEWDEDIGIVAPITQEDETWTSMYKWYAAILESTGSALSIASKVSNGIDQQDVFARAALHYSAEQGHLEAANLLVEAGCKVDIPTVDGLTPLHVAAARDQPALVQALLAAGANVNYKTHDKMTALHFASSRGLLETVKVLVSRGAYVEARDTNERTALYLAAGRGHCDVVEHLVTCGANVNGEEIHGYTPLCEAVWQRYPAVVSILLKSKARITHSHRLLHNAIIQRQDEIVKMLADMGGGVNLYNEHGDTPLLLAASLGQANAVRLLLERGAHVNMCSNITGATALHVAAEHVEGGADFERLLLVLLERGADMNAVALTGDTPLNRALLLQRDEAAEYLIKYGADVNTQNQRSAGLDNLSLAGRMPAPRLAGLLVLAGHPLPTPDDALLSEKCAPAPGVSARWVCEAARRPLRLADHCRIRIRREGRGRALPAFVQRLPLPPSLMRFLMMQDE